jgi:adenylate kinase
MGKAILLSGAPGSGKSTLRNALAARISGLEHFDYGQLLLRCKLKEDSKISYEQLRKQSATIITPEDVATTDEWVISEIGRLRKKSHVLIDSHALTHESWGFRAIPFSKRQLEGLHLNVVLVLRCDPDTLIARVKGNPGGRRELTTELARDIQTLQESLCLTYAVICECPAFVIDTTQLTESEVADAAMQSLNQVGIK